ncbi:unnamed protein product [Paramecium sonneborni]|uniref:Uncharacterized protein n=1 Tax=Paramecium sonneborni TaxID=65129 RepID=A0A8S1NKU9_9CILI|nr:unnamed protein product [Paramecium sonneborni]CAD8087280.1 unnamed protein product [Paramecium sonneborni]
MNEIQTLAKINNPYIEKFIEMLKFSHNFYSVNEFCKSQTLEVVIKGQRQKCYIIVKKCEDFGF